MKNEIEALQARFGLPGVISIDRGAGGLTRVEVTNTAGTLLMLLQGAQVLAWAPQGQRPVIWTSPEARHIPGKSVRGGIPICWPWFGPAPDPAAGWPAHGFARGVDWTLLEVSALADDKTVLTLGLDPKFPGWGHRATLRYRLTVGEQLDLVLTTENTGDDELILGCALHTYFAVGDVRHAEVLGLEGRPYLDKVAGDRKTQAGSIEFAGEVDRIYLDTPDDCLIIDPVWQRSIGIEKSGSHSTVVWNPWVEKAQRLGDLGPEGHLAMLCVESANAADDVVRMVPGSQHVLAVSYSVL